MTAGRASYYPAVLDDSLPRQAGIEWDAAGLKAAVSRFSSIARTLSWTGKPRPETAPTYRSHCSRKRHLSTTIWGLSPARRRKCRGFFETMQSRTCEKEGLVELRRIELRTSFRTSAHKWDVIETFVGWMAGNAKRF